MEAPISLTVDHHARQTGEFYFGTFGENQIGIDNQIDVLHIYAIFESEVLAFNEIEASQFVKKNLDRSWLSPPTRVSEPGYSLGLRPSSAAWQAAIGAR